MRSLTAATLVLASAAATTLAAVPVASGAPAAPADPWVLESESAFTEIVAAVPGRTPGHPGNWHAFDIRVVQDDAGLIGGMVDYRCPAGQHPWDEGDDCVQLSNWATEDFDATVTWSPRLRFLHVKGTIDMANDWDGQLPAETFPISLWFRASGTYTRTVNIETHNDPGDTWQSKYVEAHRTTATASGRLGWARADTTMSQVIRDEIRVQSSYTRGKGDGV